jgi:hypothetical protein
MQHLQPRSRSDLVGDRGMQPISTSAYASNASPDVSNRPEIFSHPLVRSTFWSPYHCMRQMRSEGLGLSRTHVPCSCAVSFTFGKVYL